MRENLTQMFSLKKQMLEEQCLQNRERENKGDLITSYQNKIFFFFQGKWRLPQTLKVSNNAPLGPFLCSAQACTPEVRGLHTPGISLLLWPPLLSWHRTLTYRVWPLLLNAGGSLVDDIKHIFALCLLCPQHFEGWQCTLLPLSETLRSLTPGDWDSRYGAQETGFKS